MVDVPFRFQIAGGYADEHQLQAYDGFNALAGFALTLALVTTYVETGRIRHRGDFAGRRLVYALPLERGSVISDFIAQVRTASVLGILTPNSDETKATFLLDIVKRTFDRNLGLDTNPTTDGLKELEGHRGGDLEALAAAVEPAIKRAHAIIGEGANLVDIYGGPAQIVQLDASTKKYVNGTIQGSTIHEKDVSVASFNVNSGYGSVYDSDLGRTIPIQITTNTLATAKTVLSWGLNEYANGTGEKISLKFYIEESWDGRPKKYIVVDASIPGD